MTDNDTTPKNTPETNPKTSGERIAKAMARAGGASRREAERMILEGRVAVNGKKIASPALDIGPDDQITIDGQPMDAPQETRLWLYYKPSGLVTSASDEKGRQTVFDALPRDMPRVMSIGRLDLNSEGLLLLTNDGELKRRLELPATGWLRRYRVRVNGRPTDLTFDPLRRGAVIEGEEFAPMEVKLDSQQGANAWLTVGIREGRNREIRRAMAHVGLAVNRLIRVGYGPFRLTGLEENEVREIKRRMLRDQLGGLLTGDVEEKPREFRGRGAEGGDRGRDGGKPFARRDGAERPFQKRGDDERRPFTRSGDKEGGFARSRDESGRKPFGAKPFERRDGEGRKPSGPRDDKGAKPFERREPWAGKQRGEKPGSERAGGDKPASRWKTGSGKPGGGHGGKPGQDGPRKTYASGPGRTGGKPAGGKAAPLGGKPRRAPNKGARPEGSGPRKPRG